MKKSIAILFLSILTAFSTFFSSCENLVNDEVESTSQKGKINYVNISEVPFLIPTIQKFNPDYAFLSDPSKPSNKETLNLNLDLNSILEYIGSDGRKTYSIKILHEFNDYDDKYLENLHVFKENEEYKSFILKFNSLDDTKPFDENTFTGDAEIYDLEHELQSISNYEDGILRCNKIINGPWHIWIHNGTIDVWNDGSGDEGGDESNTNTNEFVFLATAPPAPGENGGGGAMSTNLDVMLFLNDLTEEQLSIVQQFPELITYLEENNASQESKQLILQLLNFFQNYSTSTVYSNWLAQHLDTAKSILNYITLNNYSEESITEANQTINAIINNQNIEEPIKKGLVPPSCEAFEFSPLGTANWQVAATKNIVALIGYYDIGTGEYNIASVIFPQPIYFGIPKNSPSNGGLISSGKASNLTAKALNTAIQRAKLYFISTQASSSQVQAKLWEYIRDEMANGAYVKGGSASFTPPNGYTGNIKDYESYWFFEDDCD